MLLLLRAARGVKFLICLLGLSQSCFGCPVDLRFWVNGIFAKHGLFSNLPVFLNKLGENPLL